MKKFVNKTVQIIGSRYFFWFVIALFVFQAMWVALSFRYPIIFDESYHMPLIQYFSHQWLPWVGNQPVSFDQFGAFDRSPYLLYHYLMSFPFRVVALFTDNFPVQVIAMRFVNIGLFAGGLVIFAKLFKAMKIQPIFRNISLLFFILLPITPWIAATVNYDSLTFLLTAGFLLLGVKIIYSDALKWQYLAGILTIGMAGSLVKNEFLPIFAAGTVFIFIWFIRKKEKNFVQIIKSYRASSLWWKLGLIIPLLLVGGFFLERFGINIIKYRAIEPPCTSQMSALRCESQWQQVRANKLLELKTKKIPDQVPINISNWGSSMMYRLMYTAETTPIDNVTHVGDPLPIVYTVVFIGSIVSSAAFFYGFDRLRRIRGFWFVVTISVVYFVALFYVNLSSYYTYYSAIAVQGRYLLPILPVMTVLLLLGLNDVLRKKHVLKLVILTVVFVLYLNGAGVITHIMRSDDNWDWDNQAVRQVNDNTRNLLRPFVTMWWYDKK